MDDELKRHLAAQKRAFKQLDKAIALIAQAAPYVWNFGDGDGGYVINRIRDAIHPPASLTTTVTPWRAGKAKARIPRDLMRAVMERDAYRCLTCGAHNDLTCDHIHPESRGGETSFENLQTLCRSCNSKKGTKIVPLTA